MKEGKRSKLQFNNPRITNFEFKSSTSFDAAKYKGLGINYESSVTNMGENEADVSLTIKVGLDDETVPFLIRVTSMARFCWEDGLDQSKVEKLLNVNAKTLLLSYLRPFISHIVVDAGYPPFVLPFFDFSERE